MPSGFRTPAFVLLALLSISGIVASAWWTYDVWLDRQKTLDVSSPSPIYKGRGSELCEGTVLMTVQAGTHFKVKRVRYWKNCATIDVELPDKSLGHFVLDRLTLDPQM
jgi:hypothetical protein